MNYADVQTLLTVAVHPNAGRNELLGFMDEVLHVKIAAPPIKGKANKELIEFLCQLLGTGKSSVTIEKGLTSRKKTIKIHGIERLLVLKRLAANCA
ncbi:MAG: DUF167 domain-containing protein [Dehalococcoidia bacterium]|nr:DUF167 domain-containing protein [Dehalococcoidia bacterium]MDZ4247024.1 DUF167 domain-containing protein [Dehalococcoidia bacterium]